jgi:NADH-quinone oxidoreductase subunit E
MPDLEATPDLLFALKKWRNKRGNLIMILHELQDHHGYVPRELALLVAKELNVPLARIYEVLTFYHYFKLKPPGKFVISACLGTACYLKGGDAVFQELSRQLDVQPDVTSEDGLHHLQGVRCLGCCGLAPVVMVNGRIYSKADAATVAAIKADCQHQHEQEQAHATS